LLREQLAPLGRIAMRRMFGKSDVFCDGVMFGREAPRPAFPFQ
jgi:DNA transformation protein